ncbi:MAG: hypothetical protein VW518_06370 [Burkholderiaceae bacterium]
MKRLYVHENIYDEVCDELATIANDTIMIVVHDIWKRGCVSCDVINHSVFNVLHSKRWNSKLLECCLC